jgi:hypothetical protein
VAKLRFFAAYVVLALVAAGLFGALHDQISYTVSQEYYTRFKFLQFSLLDPAVPERLRAAWVGFLASWWMGIPLGVLTGLAGFVQRTPQQMWRALLLTLPLVMGFTLVVALIGLVYGFSQTAKLDPAAYQGWYLPQDLVHVRSFLCAGYMHHAAYLGGVLAIPGAWIFHAVFRRVSAHET